MTLVDRRNYNLGKIAKKRAKADEDAPEDDDDPIDGDPDLVTDKIDELAPLTKLVTPLILTPTMK
jgi:hypothetical protein